MFSNMRTKALSWFDAIIFVGSDAIKRKKKLFRSDDFFSFLRYLGNKRIEYNTQTLSSNSYFFCFYFYLSDTVFVAMCWWKSRLSVMSNLVCDHNFLTKRKEHEKYKARRPKWMMSCYSFVLEPFFPGKENKNTIPLFCSFKSQTKKQSLFESHQHHK